MAKRWSESARNISMKNIKPKKGCKENKKLNLKERANLCLLLYNSIGNHVRRLSNITIMLIMKRSANN